MHNWVVLLLLMIVWLYIISIFKRRDQAFFFFIVGGVGLFFFSFLILSPILTAPLATLVCNLTGIVGRITGMFKAYATYSILFIENANGPISLYVDFECAGLVEILVFLSLLVFFQAYKWREKILVGALGCIGILAANVLRLTVICVMIHVYGNDIYYLAHTIIGRLVFYMFTISLYFYVFTRRQIRQQRVGEFEYNDKVD